MVFEKRAVKMDKDIVSRIMQSVSKLWTWMKIHNFTSYDHYDLLATRYGVASKALLKYTRGLGLLAVSPIMALDLFIPMTRKYFFRPKRSAEAIPRIIQGCYRLLSENVVKQECISVCQDLLDWLVENKVETQHGWGWGLQFDWQSEAYLPKNTPCATITALVAAAFYETYLINHKERYLELLQKAAGFMVNDLNKDRRYGVQVFSYSPYDHRLVINANSFVAVTLLYILQFFPNTTHQTVLDGLLEYIIKEQNEDGSWFYHDKQQVSKERNFIDSFHSCFILENLFKIWQMKRDAQILNAIQKGYDYFINNNLNDREIVKLYNKYPYIHGIVIDIRSCAEGISCLSRLSELFPEALPLAIEIADKTMTVMQNGDGSFAFRQYWWGKNRMPYMRWGQAPMFHGLCVLLEKTMQVALEERTINRG